MILFCIYFRSIAVWDYSESKFWHSNTQKHRKRFVPTQITTPTWDNTKNSNNTGQCVAIRSVFIAHDAESLIGYNSKQLCSLHECGLLVLWSILSKSNGSGSDLTKKRINHQSMWGKVELIQTKMIDLRSSFSKQMQMKMSRPTSSSFDKTRSYFESELFSDVALKELQDMNSIETKLVTSFRCTGMEMTREGILIVTNENFLMFGRKSLKNDSFRRIQIDVNSETRIDDIAMLFTPDEDIVLIALNNGCVKTLCCDQNSEIHEDTASNSDVEDGGSASSGSSLSPAPGAASQFTAASSSFSTFVTTSSTGPLQMMIPSTVNGNFAFDGNGFAGKSCTIQSLVQNERKIYDESQALGHLDNNEYKVPFVRSDNKSMQQPGVRTTHLVNGQIILNSSFGSHSRQRITPLVKSNRIVLQQKDRLCVYDIITADVSEISAEEINMESFISAQTSLGDRNEEFLVRELCIYRHFR